jgi:hypothetical protein
VGNGYDEVAQAPSPTIGSSSGSFQSITGLTSESDSVYGTNYWGLQDNTNFFTTTTTYTGGKSTTGWEQFVFLNDPGANTGYLFMQYWLINYQNQYKTCPTTGPLGGTSWYEYAGSCYANGPQESVPLQAVTNLSNLMLKGYADFNSNDEDMFCVSGGSCYDVATTYQVLNLYEYWQDAEFNVFGYCCGDQANFNTGTSITIVNTLNDQSGNVIIPSCVITGYTGETSNLNLGSCSSNSNGQIVFTESKGGSGTEVTMTVSYAVVGGGSPSPPTFNYYFNGAQESLTLTKRPKAVTVDAGTNWSVTPNPLGGSSSFQRWYSSQTLMGTASSATIVFSFQHQYYLTMKTSTSGIVTPSSGWYNSGAKVTITATATSGYKFKSWTGTGTGSYTGTKNPATITMNAAITETATFS